MPQDRSKTANGNGENSPPMSGNGHYRIRPKPSRWIGTKFWHIVYPYCASEERWLALALLVITVAFVVVKVYVSVIFNETSGRFFNALQDRNSVVFYQTLSFTVLLRELHFMEESRKSS